MDVAGMDTVDRWAVDIAFLNDAGEPTVVPMVHTLGVVWLFSAHGEPLQRIDSPTGRLITNLAYGGDDHGTLYITESETGSVLAVDVQTPGQPMYSHRD